MYDEIVVGDVVRERNLGGGTLCEKRVTIKVSTGMGDRVILAGKLQIKKTI